MEETELRKTEKKCRFNLKECFVIISNPAFKEGDSRFTT